MGESKYKMRFLAHRAIPLPNFTLKKKTALHFKKITTLIKQGKITTLQKQGKNITLQKQGKIKKSYASPTLLIPQSLVSPK